MSNYKEIITKAVIGKGKKYFKNKYSVTSDVLPSTILGCWIINNKFKGSVQGDDVLVNGSFDINIWYSYDNDTKTNVINQNIKYNEVIAVKTKLDVDFNDSEIIVRYLKRSKKNIKHFLIIYGILQKIKLYMKQIKQVQNYQMKFQKI